MQIKEKHVILEIVQDDITNLKVDCIVNAANTELQLGLGVAGAIRTKGGPSIQKECNKIIKHQQVSVGEAVITNGGKLKASYIIHAVGPLGSNPHRKNLLQNAIKNSLILADSKRLSSIAIPAISTGIFGYPMDEAADVIITACKEFSTRGTYLKHIIICLYDEFAFNTFREILKKLDD